MTASENSVRLHLIADMAEDTANRLDEGTCRPGDLSSVVEWLAKVISEVREQ